MLLEISIQATIPMEGHVMAQLPRKSCAPMTAWCCDEDHVHVQVVFPGLHTLTQVGWAEEGEECGVVTDMG